MIFYWILALALHREAKNKGSYLDWVWQVWRVSCIWCPAVNVTFSSCLVTQFGRWNPSERVSKLRLKAVTMVTLSVEKMRVKVARLPSKIMQFFFYFSGKALPHRCGVNRTVGLLQYIQSYTHTHRHCGHDVHRAIIESTGKENEWQLHLSFFIKTSASAFTLSLRCLNRVYEVTWGPFFSLTWRLRG